MPLIIRKTLYTETQQGAYYIAHSNNGQTAFRAAQSGIPTGCYYTESEYEAAKATDATAEELAALKNLIERQKDWQQEMYKKRETELVKLRYDVQRLTSLRAQFQMKCYEYGRIGKLLGKARARNRKYHRTVKELNDRILRLEGLIAQST